jgi:hypothetical protein
MVAQWDRLANHKAKEKPVKRPLEHDGTLSPFVTEFLFQYP